MENHSVLAKEKWWGEDKILQQINGFWYSHYNIPRTQRVLTEFKPRTDDVILVSFPKTGTTWLKALLYSISNPSSLDSLVKKNPHDLVPFLEYQVYGQSSESNILSSSNFETTRIFSTHIAYQLLGKTFESSGCRVVYVDRNPKDTLNSFWHFANKWTVAKEEPWELEEAVEKFCRGLVLTGPYYEHVLGYREASLTNPSKVFFVTYEELKDDTKTHVKRLAEFLGCHFVEGDNRVEEIIKNCSFDVLSNHEVNKLSDCPSWFSTPYNSFFRKATVDDHKIYLSNEAIETIDSLTREKFHKSSFIYGI